MIHTLDPGISNANFNILDIVFPDDFRYTAHLFSFTAASWSMFPTIQKGDVLTIDAADRIEVGDVVVFPLMGALVCHRVTRVDASGAVHTRGDAANRPDAPIQHQDILGKVTGIARGHDRLAPAFVPHPSSVHLAHMKLDLLWARMREHVRTWMLRCLAFLKHREWIKRIAVVILTRYVRFYLGIRAPIQSVRAYRFVPLSSVARDHMAIHVPPPGCRVTDDVLIQARLGRHRLGTWHPASGTMRIRRAAAGLGLENALQTACRSLSVQHPVQLHRSSVPVPVDR